MKLFLTSWPSGELKPVEIIEKHRTISNAVYIRYEHGGTDTTTDKFLFDIPKSLASVQAENDAYKKALIYIADECNCSAGCGATAVAQVALDEQE